MIHYCTLLNMSTARGFQWAPVSTSAAVFTPMGRLRYEFEHCWTNVYARGLQSLSKTKSGHSNTTQTTDLL